MNIEDKLLSEKNHNNRNNFIFCCNFRKKKITKTEFNFVTKFINNLGTFENKFFGKGICNDFSI